MAAPIDPENETWRVTHDLLGVLDATGIFKHTNPAWLRTLGLERAEIEEKQFFDFVHPEDVDKTQMAFVDIQVGKPVLEFENRYRHRDGHYLWLSWNAVPEGGLFYCSARDITQYKENAATLQSREEEAVLREQFVAILGHDLRNPLAAIGSAIRIASREDQSEKTTAMLDTIRSSADRIADLIELTTDFARARMGGGLSVALAPAHDLRGGFERVIDEIRLANPERDLSFDFDFDDILICDPARLDQLLSNLISNAVTHGAANKPVKVAVYREADDCVIMVSNMGTPIPADIIPTLFEPFARANEASMIRGLGLGLFIASQIAHAHGGRIDVSSNDEATTFALKIPIG